MVIGTVMAVLAPTSEKVNPLFCWGVLVNVSMTMLVLIFRKAREPKPVNWATPEVAFSISFVIVHFLYVFMWLTQVYDMGEEIWYFRYAHCPDTVCKTLAMCSASLSCFLFGYTLVKPKQRRAKLQVNRRWRLLGKLMARISLVALAGYVAMMGARFWGGYYKGSGGGDLIGNTLFNTFQGLILAAVAVVVISRASLRSRSKQWFAVDLFLVAIGAVSLLIHGDRSTFLLILVAVIAAYSEFIRPIRFRTAVLGFVGLFMLLGISQIARTGIGGDRTLYSFFTVSREYADDSFEISAKTFSGSVLTAFVAVDFVPEKHDYYYGRMKLLTLAGIVPFGRSAMGIEQSIDTSTSNLFTYLIQGSRRGVAGTGTSAFAEFYVEGGFVTCLVGFALMGILFRWITEKSRSSNDIRWHVAYVCLVAVLCISARMMILELLVRQVLYPVIYTIVIAYMLGIRFKAKPSSNQLVTPFQPQMRQVP